VTPPQKECIVTSYFDLKTPKGLRHGIYDLPAVQTEIALILAAIAVGLDPSLEKQKAEEYAKAIQLNSEP
jgi:hypothetical protein